MPSFSIPHVLQLALAVGLLNVWLVRRSRATAFRGGEAQSLEAEFAVYGLPGWAFYVVGASKIGIAIALLVGLWVPALVPSAATFLLLLMLGALVMHRKVGDPLTKSMPALLMLALSGTLLGFMLA